MHVIFKHAAERWLVLSTCAVIIAGVHAIHLCKTSPSKTETFYAPSERARYLARQHELEKNADLIVFYTHYLSNALGDQDYIREIARRDLSNWPLSDQTRADILVKMEERSAQLISQIQSRTTHAIFVFEEGALLYEVSKIIKETSDTRLAEIVLKKYERVLALAKNRSTMLTIVLVDHVNMNIAFIVRRDGSRWLALASQSQSPGPAKEAQRILDRPEVLALAQGLIELAMKHGKPGTAAALRLKEEIAIAKTAFHLRKE